MTGKKQGKTSIAREALVRALKGARRPLTVGELLDRAAKDKAVVELAVPRTTLAAQLSFALREPEPRVVRAGRALYRHVDTAVEEARP